jgi:hypothetical protein
LRQSGDLDAALISRFDEALENLATLVPLLVVIGRPPIARAGEVVLLGAVNGLDVAAAGLDVAAHRAGLA